MTKNKTRRLADLPPPPAGKTGWPWTEESPVLPGRMPDGAEWPRISIVTPSFNQARFLEETIRSVLLQNYPNLEYIIIDGGSTDGSLPILRKYQPFIDFSISESNKGHADALNKGMQHSTGEILGFINSDDYYLPGAFAHAAGQLSGAKAPDMVYGGCRFVDQESREYIEHFGDISNLDDILDFWNVWCGNREIVQPEAFWRRSISDKIGPFNTRYTMMFVYEYWCRMLIAGAKFSKFDQAVACFRIQPDQKSQLPGDAVFNEWLEMAEPWLWDTSLHVPSRARLKGEWLCHKRFFPTINSSWRSGEPKWQRWARLAGLCARHPRILSSQAFKRRMRETMGRPG